MSQLYNHMFDVAFTLVNASEEGDASATELLDALQKRINYLRANPCEVSEAFGKCDTYPIEE